MQQKKYFHHLIGILFCCVTFSSCLDDNEPETVYPTLGTVNADGKDIIIESDSYGPLVPVNPGFITSTQTDSTGQRIMAVFQYAGETAKKTSNSTSVELIRVNKVLTKKANDLRQAGTEDIYGNAPIQITASSISQKHLNIQYEYYGSTNISHRISLVLNADTRLDENGLLQVEFRHNNEGDTYTERLWGIVSYTLESIPDYKESECKGFKIVYNSGANKRAEWIVKTNSQGTQTEENPSRFIASCCF